MIGVKFLKQLFLGFITNLYIHTSIRKHHKKGSLVVIVFEFYTFIFFLSFQIYNSATNGIPILFRFLVLCSYQPETLTVRAGISLPTSGGHYQGSRGQAHISMPYEDEDNNSLSGKRSRTGRVLQKPEALGKILSNLNRSFSVMMSPTLNF